MPIPIELKIEQAVAEIIANAVESLGLKTYYGVDDRDIEESCIIVNATSFEPQESVGTFKMNGLVEVEVSVVSNFAVENTPRETHWQRVEAVRDALTDSEFLYALSVALGGANVYGDVFLKARRISTDGGKWKHTTVIAVAAHDG